jgi:hypothetical protein
MLLERSAMLKSFLRKAPPVFFCTNKNMIETAQLISKFEEFAKIGGMPKLEDCWVSREEADMLNVEW